MCVCIIIYATDAAAAVTNEQCNILSSSSSRRAASSGPRESVHKYTWAVADSSARCIVYYNNIICYSHASTSVLAAAITLL